MNFPFGITVTLITRTPTGQDALGNDVFTDTTVDVANCFFDPGGSVELVQGQDMVTTKPTLYLPDEALTVGPFDQVVVDGVKYEVDGTPNYPVNPWTGWAPCIVAHLKVVTG